MEPYEFAIRVVREAGKIIREGKTKNFEIMSKGGDPKDVVTSVDLEVDSFIRNQINKYFPGHGIYSEEGGELGDKEYVWTVDPIDGSSNYARGIPHAAVVVGLIHSGVPTCGAVYNPMTDELFSFKKGEGAYLNGRRLNVSEVSDLKDATAFFHAGRKPEVRDWGGESYRRLLGAAKKTNNYASSSLDTCFVAAGRIDINIYGTLSTLDISCAFGILKEAGGVVSDSNGNMLELTSRPQRVYMANNEKMLNEVRNLLEG